MTSPVALIIGAGDATGGAIARRFAREGYVACVTRRSLDKLQPLLDQIKTDGGQAHGYASDARKEEEVIALVELIESTLGPIEVLVFNIGANAPSSVLEETARINRDRLMLRGVVLFVRRRHRLEAVRSREAVGRDPPRRAADRAPRG